MSSAIFSWARRFEPSKRLRQPLPVLVRAVFACVLAAALGWATPAAVQAQPVASALASQMAVAPVEITQLLPRARLQGRGRLRVLGFRVYEAQLWVGAEGNFGDWRKSPFALEVRYERALKGTQIAERSLKEMQRQKEIAPDTAQRWLTQLKTLFPDVSEGDRLSALHLPSGGARFFMNGQALGEVSDPVFSEAFFAIWLSSGTSEPELRAALLGSVGKPDR